MSNSLQQIEQNLAEIAVSQISEKNPNLLNYYLGFDIIDKNDDGTRAAGIMGFKLGGQLIYIPVFFLSGKTKGMEVMYLKNSDTFVANNEQWVNYIASQSPEDIGSAVPETQKPQDMESSNSLRLFSRPPGSASSKAASLEEMYQVDVSSLIDEGIALGEPSHDLVDFLKKAGYETCMEFVKLAVNKPQVLRSVSKLYDLSDVKEAIEEVATEHKKEAKVAKESGPEIQLITTEEIISDPSLVEHLSNEQKTAALEKGYTVKDLRHDDTKNSLYVGDHKTRFNQVTTNGKYKMLNAAGEIVDAIVFAKVNRLGKTDEKWVDSFSPQLVVSPSGSKAVWSREPAFAFVESEHGTDIEGEEKDFLGSKGSTPSSVTINSTYVIVDKEGVAYGPVRIENKIRDGERITFVCEQPYVPMRASALLSTGCASDGAIGAWHEGKIYVRLLSRESGKVEFSGGAVFIPKDVKFVEIDTSSYDQERGTDKEVVLTPGDYRMLDTLLMAKGGTKFVSEKSASTDIVTSIDGYAMSFRNRGEFVLDLMSRSGISEVGAEKVAEELFANGKRQVIGWALPKKKVAYPDVPNPQGMSGTNRDGTPLQTQEQDTREMVPANTNIQDATELNIDLWKQVTDDDIKFLERASDSNSRQVFDPAMIGVLVRTSRANSIVGEYIPELVDNLDRMCRLLLLFYWHNADFAEEYGIDEMSDFEDLVLSAIKDTAKVVLFLKQRAVESSVGRTDVLE